MDKQSSTADMDVLTHENSFQAEEQTAIKRVLGVASSPHTPQSSAFQMFAPGTKFLGRVVELLVDGMEPEGLVSAAKETGQKSKSSAAKSSGARDYSNKKQANPVSRSYSSSDFGAPVDELTLLASVERLLVDDSVAAVRHGQTYAQCMRSTVTFNESGISPSNPPVVRSSASELHITLNEGDISRIALSFICIGAPLSLEQPDTSGLNIKTHTCLNWTDFAKFAGVHIPSKYLRHLYESCWLPFCNAICQDGLKFLNKRETPNPLLPPSDHSATARNLCLIFLTKQKLLRTMHYCIEEKLLHNSSQHQLSSFTMPEWWQTLHDIELVRGCLAHGYMNLGRLKEEPTHPFHSSNLPATKVCDASSFPADDALEIRLIELLHACTKALPASDVHHVSMQLMESFTLKNRTQETDMIDRLSDNGHHHAHEEDDMMDGQEDDEIMMQPENENVREGDERHDGDEFVEKNIIAEII
jgi:hypothetical protein